MGGTLRRLLLVVMLLALYVGGWSWGDGKAVVNELAPTSVCPITSSTQLFCLHNYARKVNGVPRLYRKPGGITSPLYHSARLKRDKIIACAQFTHNPCGMGTFDFFPAGWSFIGENLAYGYPTLRQTFQAWLDSPGHRSNILNPGFTEYGASGIKTGIFPYLWVTNFGRRSVS